MPEISGPFPMKDCRSLLKSPHIGKTPIPGSGKYFRPQEFIKACLVPEKKFWSWWGDYPLSETKKYGGRPEFWWLFLQCTETSI